MAAEPDVRVTHYEVSCVPRENLNGRHFIIHLKRTRDGSWVITDGYLYLTADGAWVDDPYGANHRYDEQTAFRLAKAAAPLMTVNGHTVAEALASHTGAPAVQEATDARR